MSDEERTSEHGGEDGTDNVPGEGHDTHTRYNLRPRVTTRAQEHGHQTSPLYQTVMQGDLEARSTELLADLRRTLADTARLLSTPRTTVADALEAGRHRGSEDLRRSGFEILSSRGWLAEGRRVIEKIAEGVEYSSDEPDIHLDPHPLLVGGHKPHAGRLDPKTRKCETIRAAERSLWTGQNQTVGPRRVGENSYTSKKL